MPFRQTLRFLLCGDKVKCPVAGRGFLFKKPCCGAAKQEAGTAPQDQSGSQDRGQNGSVDLRAHSWDSCIWSNLRGSWAPGPEEGISLELAMEPSSRGWSSSWYREFWKLSK